MDYKQEFLEIFYDNIERDGSDKLLEWLKKAISFRRLLQPTGTAPRSAGFASIRCLFTEEWLNFCKANMAAIGTKKCRQKAWQLWRFCMMFARWIVTRPTPKMSRTKTAFGRKCHITNLKIIFHMAMAKKACISSVLLSNFRAKRQWQ